MVDVWKYPAVGCLNQVQQPNLKSCPPTPDAKSQRSRAAQFGKPPIPTVGGQRATPSQECSPARGHANQYRTNIEGSSSSGGSQCPPAFHSNPSLPMISTGTNMQAALPPRGPQYLSEVRSQGCSPSRGPVSQTGARSELPSSFRGPHFPPGFCTSSTSSMDSPENNIQGSLPSRGPKNQIRAHSEERSPMRQQYLPGFGASPALPMKPTTGFSYSFAPPRGPQYLAAGRSQGFSPSKGPANQSEPGFGAYSSEGPQYPPAFRANPTLPIISALINAQGSSSLRSQYGVRSQGCSSCRGPVNQTGTCSKLSPSSKGPQYVPGFQVPSSLPINPIAANRQGSLPPRDLLNQMRAQSEGRPPVHQQCTPGFSAAPTLSMKPTGASTQGYLPPRGFVNQSYPPYQSLQNVNAVDYSTCTALEGLPDTIGVKTPEFPSLRSPCPLIQAGQSTSCNRPHQRYGLPIFFHDLIVQPSNVVEQARTDAFECPPSNELAAQNLATDQPCPPQSDAQDENVCPSAHPECEQQPCSPPSCSKDADVPTSTHSENERQPCQSSGGFQDENVSPPAQPDHQQQPYPPFIAPQPANVCPSPQAERQQQPCLPSRGAQSANVSPFTRGNYQQQACPPPRGAQSANATLSTLPDYQQQQQQPCPTSGVSQDANVCPSPQTDYQRQPCIPSRGAQSANVSPFTRGNYQQQICPPPRGAQSANVTLSTPPDYQQQPCTSSGASQPANVSPSPQAERQQQPCSPSRAAQSANVSPFTRGNYQQQACPPPRGAQSANATLSTLPNYQQQQQQPCLSSGVSQDANVCHSAQTEHQQQPCPPPCDPQSANVPPSAQPDCQEQAEPFDLGVLESVAPTCPYFNSDIHRDAMLYQARRSANAFQNPGRPPASSRRRGETLAQSFQPTRYGQKARNQSAQSCPPAEKARSRDNVMKEPIQPSKCGQKTRDPSAQSRLPPTEMWPRGNVIRGPTQPTEFGQKARDSSAQSCPPPTEMWPRGNVIKGLYQTTGFNHNARDPSVQSCPPPETIWKPDETPLSCNQSTGGCPNLKGISDQSYLPSRDFHNAVGVNDLECQPSGGTWNQTGNIGQYGPPYQRPDNQKWPPIMETWIPSRDSNTCSQFVPPGGQPYAMDEGSRQYPHFTGPANPTGAYAQCNVLPGANQNLEQKIGNPPQAVGPAAWNKQCLVFGPHLGSGNSFNCNTSSVETDTGVVGHRPRSLRRASRSLNCVSST
uniref:Uncharacterized protein n=1 Tax=Echinococcus granulosus TaxID=6210 RepID=A0A068WLR7_ECHGR|nr:hypothetical protein EgrG_001140600 [Echinococcus granulosus]